LRHLAFVDVCELAVLSAAPPGIGIGYEKWAGAKLAFDKNPGF
jgi:hypothetical protein